MPGSAPLTDRVRFPALAAVLTALLLLVATACGDASASSGDTTVVPATTVPATTVASTTTTTEPPPTTTTEPPTTTTIPPTTTTAAAQVSGSPLGPGANSVYVLGDSVILGAQSQVPAALAGWQVTFDAKESRRIDQGTDIVQQHGGGLGRVVVVHLCTNWGGGDYGAAAGRLLGSLQGVERVVWVTCTPWLPAVGDADAVIRALPQSHPNVVVADWAAVSGTPGYTYADGLHLKSDGAQALALVVAGAVGPAPG